MPDVTRAARRRTACLLCGVGVAPVCPPCSAALDPPPDLAPPPGLDSVAAVFAYRDAGAALVTSWKYEGERRVTGRLARAMAAARPAGPHDALTWAPTSDDRRRGRGFDPAELLARAVAVRTGLACRRLLARRPGPPQTGRSAEERAHVAGFEGVGRPPARVLVVDDVCTTGSTLAAAAAALRAGGAEHVDGLVLARTPPRSG